MLGSRPQKQCGEPNRLLAGPGGATDRLYLDKLAGGANFIAVIQVMQAYYLVQHGVVHQWIAAKPEITLEVAKMGP